MFGMGKGVGGETSGNVRSMWELDYWEIGSEGGFILFFFLIEIMYTSIFLSRLNCKIKLVFNS
jgi:hypothetical protein